VLFALYVFGIVAAMVVALVLRRSVTKGAASGFIMELPKYQMPRLGDLLIGLWQRAWIFLRRAGTIIFMVTVVLWLLLNFPRAAPGEDQIDASIAGKLANGLAVVVEPIGFNRDIALSLIPAMAAREVAVSSLATSYAVGAGDDERRRPWRWATGSRPLEPADRAGVPRLVRLRAAMHEHDRRHPARNQWLEMAGVHARLPVRAGLSVRGNDLLDGGLAGAGVESGKQPALPLEPMP
jgi:Fe2+ transport system protein B